MVVNLKSWLSQINNDHKLFSHQGPPLSLLEPKLDETFSGQQRAAEMTPGWDTHEPGKILLCSLWALPIQGDPFFGKDHVHRERHLVNLWGSCHHKRNAAIWIMPFSIWVGQAPDTHKHISEPDPYTWNRRGHPYFVLPRLTILVLRIQFAVVCYIEINSWHEMPNRTNECLQLNHCPLFYGLHYVDTWYLKLLMNGVHILDVYTCTYTYFKCLLMYQYISLLKSPLQNSTKCPYLRPMLKDKFKVVTQDTTDLDTELLTSITQRLCSLKCTLPLSVMLLFGTLQPHDFIHF